MSDNLDNWLGQLRSAGPDRSLGTLEASVMASVAQRRAETATATNLAPVRALAVGFAIAVGVAAGGMATATASAEPRQFSTFSSQAHLAPSTLLEGGAG